MLVQADALHIPLPDQSVHMVCFSPPYWGLRDYGIAGQLGLELTPDAYIATMMDVMGECWRVLRDDGTCWVNLGDSYAASGRGGGGGSFQDGDVGTKISGNNHRRAGVDGIPQKSLALIPFRFALAAQQAGWIVRQDIIWSKPNPMPESVRDRPTTAHEHVFLLSKSQRYFYDGDAIRKPYPQSTIDRMKYLHADHAVSYEQRRDGWVTTKNRAERKYVTPHSIGPNARSVWHIATQPYPEAHFATWPEKLVQPMIKAGTSQKGCCAECGAQWERVVEREASRVNKREGLQQQVRSNGAQTGGTEKVTLGVTEYVSRITSGWQPTCDHDRDPIPATVLDPFVGSGTTVKVARELGRRAIGLDLSMPYLRLAQQRNAQMTLWEAMA